MRYGSVLHTPGQRSALAASVIFHVLLLLLILNVREPLPQRLITETDPPTLWIEEPADAPEATVVKPDRPSNAQTQPRADLDHPLQQAAPPIIAAPSLIIQATGPQLPVTPMAGAGQQTPGTSIDIGRGAAGLGQSGSGQGDRSTSGIDPSPPNWIRKPTEDQMIRALPGDIAADQVPGSAVLACFVTPTNRVRDCKVASETEVSRGFEGIYGFGEAAMRLSRTFLIKPPMRAGRPRYDIRVRIPLVWRTR